jgi:hypothetical protein
VHAAALEIQGVREQLPGHVIVGIAPGGGLIIELGGRVRRLGLVEAQGEDDFLAGLVAVIIQLRETAFQFELADDVLEGGLGGLDQYLPRISFTFDKDLCLIKEGDIFIYSEE